MSGWVRERVTHRDNTHLKTNKTAKVFARRCISKSVCEASKPVKKLSTSCFKKEAGGGGGNSTWGKAVGEGLPSIWRALRVFLSPQLRTHDNPLSIFLSNKAAHRPTFFLVQPIYWHVDQKRTHGVLIFYIYPKNRLLCPSKPQNGWI